MHWSLAAALTVGPAAVAAAAAAVVTVAVSTGPVSSVSRSNISASMARICSAFLAWLVVVVVVVGGGGVASCVLSREDIDARAPHALAAMPAIHAALIVHVSDASSAVDEGDAAFGASEEAMLVDNAGMATSMRRVGHGRRQQQHIGGRRMVRGNPSRSAVDTGDMDADNGAVVVVVVGALVGCTVPALDVGEAIERADRSGWCMAGPVLTAAAVSAMLVAGRRGGIVLDVETRANEPGADEDVVDVADVAGSSVRRSSIAESPTGIAAPPAFLDTIDGMDERGQQRLRLAEDLRLHLGTREEPGQPNRSVDLLDGLVVLVLVVVVVVVVAAAAAAAAVLTIGGKVEVAMAVDGDDGRSMDVERRRRWLLAPRCSRPPIHATAASMCHTHLL
ncbi:hypothetical protein SYNPS1DRAFT_28210 [Syncephalis pseudoplumigaleata]|uniref:Uncharacterized protein n=1 Tax=Syncephalis pseudoplumigaleata TaxID=1712513 RepID=A0A4V1J1S5_9FUNG|nr:hypothetical protein SYNPS1DRAFT_28210 [Syncephalis pseudoplumigaleata]|eukprot:RKP26079.1 hypothetical protein SYNPS1DRAFT_28210 [Syncephalis pseudoplumigaleata]